MFGGGTVMKHLAINSFSIFIYKIEQTKGLEEDTEDIHDSNDMLHIGASKENKTKLPT